MKYPFQITELSQADGGGYLITFPDLPGCMSDGDTYAEAIENGKEAVDAWIAARKEWGKEIPAPSPPVGVSEHSGKFIQRVPKSLHAALAKRADLEGVSMNQLAAGYLAYGLASFGDLTVTKKQIAEFAKQAGVKPEKQGKAGAFTVRRAGTLKVPAITDKKKTATKKTTRRKIVKKKTAGKRQVN